MFFTGQARKRILQVKLRNLNFPYFANSRFVQVCLKTVESFLQLLLHLVYCYYNNENALK